MRRLFDFQCPDNHITESLVATNVTEHPCKICMKPAKRLISPVRAKLDPISGDFPGATMKWARDRAEKQKQERKANSE